MCKGQIRPFVIAHLYVVRITLFTTMIENEQAAYINAVKTFLKAKLLVSMTNYLGQNRDFPVLTKWA